jgi:ribonuclease P protein component
MNFRMIRKDRLRKRSVFRKVYEEGRSAANFMIAVHLLPNPDNERRVGFSAGKRLGNAVVRNRCKRRLRECWRLHQQEMPVGMDMIIVARRSMVNAKWDKIVTAFSDAFRRSRIVAEKNGWL